MKYLQSIIVFGILTIVVPVKSQSALRGSCADVPNWYDSDGSQYNCAWYAENDNCITYGDAYSNMGYTANEACCVCRDEPSVCPGESPLHTGVRSCNLPNGQKCSFGTESCCGETYDEVVCDCVNGEWICLYTDACIAPICETCPIDSPLDSGIRTCGLSDGTQCAYGTESCCGENYDEVVCDCVNGEWICLYTDACMAPICETCPIDSPLDSGIRTCGLSDGTRCAYGTESCCGETYDEVVCDCVNGEWICLYTDACMAPICETCPIDSPLDSGIRTCSLSDGTRCAYGTESCCGETFDEVICDCHDGEWFCLYTDSCFQQQCGPNLP